MRTPIHLSFESVIALLSRTFERLPDRRNPDRIGYSLRDSMLSAFAVFFFHHPSLLHFQHRLKQRKGRSNLETIFGVKDVPSDTQLREILDGAPTEPLRRLLALIFQRYRRSGWVWDWRTSLALGKRFYPVAIDGTDYFSSPVINCPGCLRRKSDDGNLCYRHSILAATLFKSRTHSILPIDAEPIRNTDGDDKQDCEINAAKRLVKRLRREHPKLDMLIVGDAMFSSEPIIKLLNELRLPFLLSVKATSHKETFEWVEEAEAVGDWVEAGKWEEGPAAKRRYFRSRVVREMPINQGRRSWVTFVEVWETNKEGRQIYHASWVTNLEVIRENVSEIIWIGRGRWKIENEHFNIHKNGGYELEHNFGHGSKTLSEVFYYLNLLAFVVHKVLERSDRTYRRLREKWTLREMWQELKYCFHRFLVESWAQLLAEYDPELEEDSG